ncbi:hypothetical protein SAMN05444274_11014 [Mariniphaga anaerophila]|uniref:Uncharacterized protein n=1 Tax=Mariniphaga anaerophila TaxID=1484053 RepID=A0A1M5ET59_9BACT|nr:hypothetical protein [Mariniphaga anaerophila]SHF82425.1 hypothetical protein SAMN05444274_11014 [Mariniphaga anaerophila]
MKELKLEFMGEGEVKGFKFNQLLRSGRAYMYQVNDEGKIHYEVFKKRINTRHREPNVSYPTSKGFGIWAKTTRDFNTALDYLIQYSKKNG